MPKMLNSRNLVEELEQLGTSTNTERIEQLAAVIQELRENCDEDPEDGIAMIPKDGFKEYAEEYADEVGYLNMQLVTSTGYNITNNFTGRIGDTWPFKHIDWEAAADELAEDYVEIEFEGVTYLAR